jgi:hypothetical protein
VSKLLARELRERTAARAAKPQQGPLTHAASFQRDVTAAAREEALGREALDPETGAARREAAGFTLRDPNDPDQSIRGPQTGPIEMPQGSLEPAILDAQGKPVQGGRAAFVPRMDTPIRQLDFKSGKRPSQPSERMYAVYREAQQRAALDDLVARMSEASGKKLSAHQILAVRGKEGVVHSQDFNDKALVPVRVDIVSGGSYDAMAPAFLAGFDRSVSIAGEKDRVPGFGDRRTGRPARKDSVPQHRKLWEYAEQLSLEQVDRAFPEELRDGKAYAAAKAYAVTDEALYKVLNDAFKGKFDSVTVSEQAPDFQNRDASQQDWSTRDTITYEDRVPDWMKAQRPNGPRAVSKYAPKTKATGNKAKAVLPAKKTTAAKKQDAKANVVSRNENGPAVEAVVAGSTVGRSLGETQRAERTPYKLPLVEQLNVYKRQQSKTKSEAGKRKLQKAMDALRERIATARAKLGNDATAVATKAYIDENVKFDSDNVVSQTASNGPHDTARETALVRTLSKALGLDENITVKDATVESGVNDNSGAYVYSDGTIYVGKKLTGAERMEVIQHELGHHVLRSFIAKQYDLKPADMSGLSIAQMMDLLKNKDAKLHAALTADFDAWKTKNVGKRKTKIEVRESRAGKLRGKGLRARNPNGGMLVSEMTAEDARSLYDMEEWIADNIVRALNTNDQATGIVEKFFKSIADVLRKAYDMVFKGNEKFLPAKSVDDWVKGMFDANVRAVSMATGQTVNKVRANQLVEAAVKASLVNFEMRGPEGRSDPIGAPLTKTAKQAIQDILAPTMEFVRTTMPKSARLALDQALNRADILQRISKKVDSPEIDAMMEDGATGMEARIAVAYMLYRDGQLKVGKEAAGALMTMGDDVRALLSVAGDGVYAARILDDWSKGRIERLKDRYDAKKAIEREWGTAERVANRISEVYDKVTMPITKLIAGARERLDMAGVPELRKLGALLVNPQGSQADDPGLVPSIVHKKARLQASASKIFENLTDRERLKVVRALQRGLTDKELFEARAAIKSKDNDQKALVAARESATRVITAVGLVRDFMERAYAYAKEDSGVVMGKQKNFGLPVMLDIRNDHAKGMLKDLLMTKDGDKHKFEQAIRELFAAFDESKQGDKPVGDTFDRSKIPPLDPKAVEYFEKKRAQMKGRRDAKKAIAVNASILAALQGTSIKAVESSLAAAEARAEAGLSQAAAELNSLERRYMTARIKQLRDAGVPEDLRPLTGAKAEPVERTFEEMVDDLVERASSEPGVADTGSGSPNFRAANFRSMQFIYDLGSKDDIRKFASLQSADAADIFQRYIDGLVRKAEYNKRFGTDGEKLQAMFDAARKQGATDADIAYADDLVKAAIGTYGADGSPTLRKIAPGLASRIHGRGTQAAIQGVQTYQNYRLLPLSVLSSFADPLGVAVRAGGDFATAWKGFKAGIKTLLSDKSKAELTDMMSMLGAGADMVESYDALAPQVGGSLNPVSKQMNEWLFKYNGLSGWTRATRFMALHSAHEFLAKHASGDGEHSSRYLRELNLKPGELQIDKVRAADGTEVNRVKLLNGFERSTATQAELDTDNRVRKALMTFVDDAILRPNVLQTPLWYNDPYLGIVTQYKAFAYAIYDQIAGRIGREMRYGNASVLLAAAMYLPVVLIAELIRELLQWGPSGNPSRADWGPGDYTYMAVMRSGLTGPSLSFKEDIASDFAAHRFPGASQAGPAAGQVLELGDGRGGDVEKALPFNPLWKNWINISETSHAAQDNEASPSAAARQP